MIFQNPTRLASLFTILAMVYLAAPFTLEYRLYSLHPIGMGLFIAASITAALTLQRSDQQSKHPQSRKSSVVTHAGLQIAALLGLLVGFAAIYQNKINKGKKHFQTYHSYGGLALFIGALSVSILGICMHFFPTQVFGTLLKSKRYLSIKRYSGLALLTITVYTTALGLISHSTQERISALARLIIFLITLGSTTLAFWNTFFEYSKGSSDLDLDDYEAVHELK
ncbi:hypothetical protein BCR33DRAFT_855204 [Rhizoclosmatium globosum]|uniref:Cytochrome b561 domain-containing protein n=1 Tax=Rhizoclosmatium globosum TaxID=329046 RepID=A0A1Y2BNY0_9FUNG|nr:hypothetical protein BCR33DRAFT_855204 [Rhizoclosmatium globosum]|eukprot:ORY36460.1 hypothetical protein BCR33DRAFT_855204 [Rhizoclosmatium globosum]